MTNPAPKDDRTFDLIFQNARELSANKEFEKAREAFRQAIALEPESLAAHFNLANAAFQLRDYNDSIRNYRKCIEINPDFIPSYINLGLSLAAVNKFDEAISSYRNAISLSPDDYYVHFNLANALKDISDLDGAIDSYGKSIALNPNFADSRFNLANTLVAVGRIEHAIASYQQALALNPKLPIGYGKLVHAQMLVCDWSGLDELKREIFAKVDRGEVGATPFVMLSLTDSLDLQRRAAAAWAANNHANVAAPPDAPTGRPHRKIRIGYFSMDFKEHPVSTLLAGVIESHSRDIFEVFAFSYGVDTKDKMRQRMEAAFDHFLDVREKSDFEIAQLARELQIDIAIDLAGFTTGSRHGIIALRPAPIQVNYLGFVGTQGVEYIDYIIADKTVIPHELSGLYSEKIAFLPQFQANDNSRVMSDRVFTKGELGFPDQTFLFCCFNNNYKFTPEMFSVWMEILHACPNAGMLMLAQGETAQANLRREAQARGIAAERLVFAGRLPPPDYLARFKVADLFLDTLPYNSGTTASDALWAGLPVLTCTGQAYASRMAAALLEAIGMPELVATTLDEYRNMAISLATDPEKMKRLRIKLQASITQSSLYDVIGFTDKLEQSYIQMFERRHANLPPDHVLASELLKVSGGRGAS